MKCKTNEKLHLNIFNNNKYDNIKILTYNIKLLFSNKIDKKNLENIFKNYDIIVLQEYFKKDNWIINFCKKYSYNYTTDKTNYSFFDSGLIILSRYKFNSIKFIEFNNKTGIERLAKKGFIIVNISILNKNVNIINTHLQASIFGYPNLSYTTIKQIKQLLNYVKNINNVIVAGDFNLNEKNIKKYNSKLTIYKSMNPTIYFTFLNCLCTKISSIKYVNSKSARIDLFLTSRNIIMSKPISEPFNNISDHLGVYSQILKIN